MRHDERTVDAAVNEGCVFQFAIQPLAPLAESQSLRYGGQLLAPHAQQLEQDLPGRILLQGRQGTQSIQRLFQSGQPFVDRSAAARHGVARRRHTFEHVDRFFIAGLPRQHRLIAAQAIGQVVARQSVLQLQQAGLPRLLRQVAEDEG